VNTFLRLLILPALVLFAAWLGNWQAQQNEKAPQGACFIHR
jgi:hypothetical protein